MPTVTDDQIRAALAKYPSKQKAADSLNLHVSAFKRRLIKLDASVPLASIASVPDEPLVSLPDKVDGTVDWEKALIRHGNLAAAREAEELQQKKCTVDLTKHGSDPICIMLMSDVHIGSAQCDTAALISHIKLLKNIPNLYTIIHGDLMEFAISQRMLDAVLGQTGSVQEQARVYQAILHDLGSKVLAVCSGNHDERSARMCGVDVVEFLLRAVKGRGVYLRDGGTVTLKLRGVEYFWSVMHGDGMKGQSMYSNTAASASHARFRVGWHDIHSSGHTHEPEVKVTYEPRANGAPKQPSVLLKAGSYKTKGFESYVDRMGLTGPEDAIMPAVILFPDSKQVIPFLRVEDAVDVLKGLTHAKKGTTGEARGVRKGVRKSGGGARR